jgi:hypothetical protein
MSEILGIPIIESLTWILAAVIALILIWFALRIILRLAVRFVACAVAIILLIGLAYLVFTYLR